MTEPASEPTRILLEDDALVAASRWTLWRSLARGLAHSLANASQMLALEDPGPLARDEARERITQAAAVLAQFGRPQPAPARIEDVLTDLDGLQSLQSGCPSTVLPMDVPAALPACAIPHGDLLFALLALVTNAKEACEPERATLRLRVEALPDGLRLVLEDEGPGFADAARAHAFTPFAAPRAGHLGAGLASARLLLRRHGGDVAVLRPARGAAVEVRVPAWRRTGA